MRSLSTSLLMFITLVCNGQDWALINPAYRYNYSDDGTDTISNQIRVMDVDTLGVDSFRYELNRIGVVCDTCPASLGGPCDGCFVLLDQPQFLGFDCIRSNDNWTFRGPDTVNLRSSFAQYDSWLFSAASAITATVDTILEATVLGVPDSVCRILLSTGDTILMSRSMGIVQFPYNGLRYSLIGNEGTDVGRLMPEPLDFFDFQPGDELTYRVVCTEIVAPPSGFQYPVPRTRYWMARILDRLDTPGSVTHFTSTAHTFTYCQLETDWDCPTDQWAFDINQVVADHPIVDSYPGQVLNSPLCWPSIKRYIAEYALTEDHRPILRSKRLSASHRPLDLGELTNGIVPFDTYSQSEVWYEYGLGVRRAYFNEAYVVKEVELVGAIIAGDTLITPPTIDWTVGIEEPLIQPSMLYPNPVDQTCFLYGLIPGEQAWVFDLEGRLVLSTKIAADVTALDVSGLAPGTYVVNVEGLRPQRLIIAR
jgi:hypothetical protein